MRTLHVVSVLAVALCLSPAAGKATEIKILSVGNSFSANALHYFGDIVKASGNTTIAVNAYIKKYAPQAEIVIHETWAYRDDHPKGGSKAFVSTEDMYQGLRAAYDQLAKDTGFRIIPCGDAMEMARRDPAWGKFVPDPAFDPKTAVYPALPTNEQHSLHNGYSWRKDPKTGGFRLGADKFHANSKGEYLQGCVWFEFFFGQSVVGNTFVPKSVTPEEAGILQRIAHRVVTEKQRP